MRSSAVGGQQVVGQDQRSFDFDSSLDVPAPVVSRPRRGYPLVLGIHQTSVNTLHGRTTHVLVNAGVLQRPLRGYARELVGPADHTTRNQRQPDSWADNVFGLLPWICVRADTGILLRFGLQVCLTHLGGDFTAHDLCGIYGQLLAQRLPRRGFKHGLEDGPLHRLGELEHFGEGNEARRCFEAGFDCAGFQTRPVRFFGGETCRKTALLGILELRNTERQRRCTHTHGGSNRSRSAGKYRSAGGCKWNTHRRHRHLHGLGDVAEYRVVLDIGRLSHVRLCGAVPGIIRQPCPGVPDDIHATLRIDRLSDVARHIDDLQPTPLDRRGSLPEQTALLRSRGCGRSRRAHRVKP